MRDDELQIIEKLTGVAQERIKLADDGFWSRGYVIDDGRIVFKFKKVPEVSYVSEIRTLEFVGSLSLGVSLQRVGWVSPDDRYLGVYGVVGRPLETVSQLDYQSVGAQLAFALRKLHQAHPEGAEILTLDEELSAWQGRYTRSHDRLLDYFSEKELVRLDRIMFEVVPAKLKRLGENIVYSHGDLGDGNIIIDDNGKVGIIDFSEMCYLDEAGDFMDVSSDELRRVMLDAYGADEILREKVKLRVMARPMIVLGDYVKRGEVKRVERMVVKIRRILEKGDEKV